MLPGPIIGIYCQLIYYYPFSSLDTKEQTYVAGIVG